MKQAQITVDLQEVPADGFQEWCDRHDVRYCGARGWCVRHDQWVYPGWYLVNWDGDALGYWPPDAFDAP